MESEFRQLAAVKNVIERMVLGESRDIAIEATAKARSKSIPTVLELYRLNVRELIYEIAAEMVALKKISLAGATARVERILADLDANQARQLRNKNKPQR